jgi:hypothetical protein
MLYNQSGTCPGFQVLGKANRQECLCHKGTIPKLQRG